MEEKKENKRMQLTPEQIEERKVMLFEEENNKEGIRRQIENLEDELGQEIEAKDKELQILKIEQQLKLLPKILDQLKEDYKNKKYKEMNKAKLNKLKGMLKISEGNIKVYRKQINTGLVE